GRFTVKVPGKRHGLFLVARAGGCGIDFLDLERPLPAQRVELRVVADRPICGRVLNTEGQPVRGVRVTADRVAVYPGDSLDPFLNAWKKRGLNDGAPPGRKEIREPVAA